MNLGIPSLGDEPDVRCTRAKAVDGLKFVPTHPNADEALAWMGFEAREAILDVLDPAIAEKAKVRVIAYDLNARRRMRLESWESVEVIIDDSR